MCKISVIIPVYNAEPFLRQCLQSVLGQTYRNLEILAIDDGSTDRSAEICRELSQTDNRIQVHSRENGGVSRARNYGLDIAAGEYIFFLDSDDAIHPLLLEEMMGQARNRGAEMIFCDCIRMNGREIDHALAKASAEDGRPLWQIADGEKAEEWFHITYPAELSGVSGMISRACIGDTRFDTDLTIGEDTLFMYRLFCKQRPAAYAPCPWYYYRMHQGSASHAARTVFQEQYFRCNFLIRDSECGRNHSLFALKREEKITVQMREKYAACRRKRDKDGCRKLRTLAAAERKHPLYGALPLSMRVLFVSCFWGYFLYVPLNGMDAKLLKWKEAAGNGKK